MQTPRLIAQDKANHEVYGARTATVVATVVLLGFAATGQPAGAVWAAVAAVGSAALAGRLKEWLDQRANARALAAGEPPVHSVERGDLLHTVYGGAAVAVPLAVTGLLSLGVRG